MPDGPPAGPLDDRRLSHDIDPGRAGPQAWLMTPDGQRRQTLDLIDEGFVLLAAEDGADWIAAAAALRLRELKLSA